MTDKKTKFGNYVLPYPHRACLNLIYGISPIYGSPVPIGNLVYDALGQAVLDEHNRRFEGTVIADTTAYQANQPIAYSNIPRVLSYNQILHQLTKGRITVASLTDIFYYLHFLPLGTYIDLDSIVIFPKQGPNEDLRRHVLNIIGKQETKTPLLVAGLGVEKADNDHGFTFTQTDLTKVTEAPYLTTDGRVRYDPATNSLVAAKTGVLVLTPHDQSGLRGACQISGTGLGDKELWFNNEMLLNSRAHGRVQVVQRDKKDIAKK